MNIFERMRQGELIKLEDLEYHLIDEAILRAFEITGRLNTAFHNDDEVRVKLSELMGFEIDSTTRVKLPFYTDFGQFIRLGKNVFINFGCSFMDRGGITIEDHALIGPGVKLITENHAFEPQLRANVYGKPIVIKQGAWLGAGAIVLPGVTVGENAVVAAGAIVTKNVDANTIVGENPAKVIRKI